MSDNLKNAFPTTFRVGPYDIQTSNITTSGSMLVFAANSTSDVYGIVSTPANVSNATTFTFNFNWLTNGGTGQVNWQFIHAFYDAGESPFAGNRQTSYTLNRSSVTNQILVNTSQTLVLYPNVANSTFLLRRNGSQGSDNAPDAFLQAFWFEYEVLS